MKASTIFVTLFCFTFLSYPSFSNQLTKQTSPKAHATDSIEASLSVILLDFKANATSSEAVKLEWISAFERDNETFIIERSYDATHFEEVTLIKGAGNSRHILKYEFTDTLNSQPSLYYRLKQIDINGNISYSKLVQASSTFPATALQF